MEPTPRDRWTLFERAFLILPTVMVAIVLWIISSGSEREKVRLEYIRPAVGILQHAPSDAQRDMREWAVRMLNTSAPVKLSKEQADALVDGTVKLPDYGTGIDTYYPEESTRAKPSPSPKHVP